jgi:hypothetical protein
MRLGPNMKRLREMDVADTVRACVTSGPADSLLWEVSACIDVDGMQLEVVGRDSDLEAAAASAVSVLTNEGSRLQPPSDDVSMIPVEGDSVIPQT